MSDKYLYDCACSNIHKTVTLTILRNGKCESLKKLDISHKLVINI